jgi:hypothetical protein
MITSIQSVHNYIPESNPISRIYDVTAIQCLQYKIHVLVMLFPVINVFTLLHFYFSTFWRKFVNPVWLFSVLPWYRAFHVWSWGILWIVLKWFKLPLLLLVSHLLLVAFPKLRKATVSFVMSVWQFAWNNSAPNGRILMKFDIWAFFENLSVHFKFH